MDELERRDGAQAKKAWTTPTLDSLSIKETEHWEFQWNPSTGFWENVWVS